MKIKNLMLMMIIASTATAYAEETTNISKTPKFKVPNEAEYVVAFENRAYTDFLRTVDEQNRSKGIDSGYTKKATKKSQRLHDDVDLIPVGNTSDGFLEKDKPKYVRYESELKYNFRDLDSVINNKLNLDKEYLDKLGYQRSSYANRFYFGNGNIAKDIIYLSKDNFEKEVEKSEKNGNEKYLIEGAYKTIGPRNTATNDQTEKNINLLGITMEEYYSKIEGKSKTEVAKFLQEKMTEKGVIGVFQKEDDLYTKDNKGKEWKVLWSIEPVSLYRTTEEDFRDTIFTKIYTYTPFNDDAKEERGKILYTKDNGIYLQDKLTAKDGEMILKLKEKKTGKRKATEDEINESWYTGFPEIDSDGYITKTTYEDVIKPLREFMNSAKENFEAGKEQTNIVEKYYYDKKNLSPSDFEAKWITPFKDGSFENNLKDLKKEISENKKKIEIASKEYEEAKKRVDELRRNPIWPDKIATFYVFKGENWLDKTENEKDDIILSLGLSEDQRQLIDEWAEADKIKDQKFTVENKLETDKVDEILKNHGLYENGWGNDKKWVDTVIADSNLIRNFLGKNVEFRGRGRIEGTVDLGEGYNELTITEQMTGRYGTNIILGPYSKLKNIQAVNVGGALSSANDKASISGRTSLTLDIDPTVKNTEGNLVQHALKDSDPNIVFRSTDTSAIKNRNNFKIELMTSRIGENNTTIDIGRKIDYKIKDVSNGYLDMTIPFISDSIAHELSDNKRFSKSGTSLLDVKIKDEIKRLNENENVVYRSIKNANMLEVLAPTLTTTNKRTVFTTLEEEVNNNKLVKLANYLRNKSKEEIIKDLSEFNLSNVDRKEMISLIDIVKNGETIKSNIKKEEELKAKLKSINELEKSNDYNSLDLSKLLADLPLDDKIEDLIKQKDDVEVRTKNVALIKERINKFDFEKLKKLSSEYPNLKNLEEIATKIKAIKEREVESSPYLADWYFKELLGDVKLLKENIKKQNTIMSEKDKTSKELAGIVDETLVKDLDNNYGKEDLEAYHTLKGMLYYTMREEEVLAELKNMLHQLSDRNIYSKLNKISKNEISTYTDLPFEVDHSLTDKKTKTKGGFISNRTVQENFKGNIYTAYGLYEKEQDSGTAYGAMIGGATTKHEEVYKRTLTTVATESEVKGVSAYIGGYVNKPVAHNLEWITGLGTQYGRYNVKRDMRNTYQDLQSKGKVNTIGLNTYSGFIMTYPLQEDVTLQFKGLLAYTAIKQSKVNESGDLPLDINSKMYHYVDGEAGVSFNKVFYGDDLKSKISAGAYGILGITGYKNDDLNAKVKDSTSSFGIKGDQIKKDAVKINLDYNVQMDTGYNYGLEGTYISNSKENNVKIGVKAGYVF